VNRSDLNDVMSRLVRHHLRPNECPPPSVERRDLPAVAAEVQTRGGYDPRFYDRVVIATHWPTPHMQGVDYWQVALSPNRTERAAEAPEWSVVKVGTVEGDRLGVAQNGVGVEGVVLATGLTQAQAEGCAASLSAMLDIPPYREEDLTA